MSLYVMRSTLVFPLAHLNILISAELSCFLLSFLHPNNFIFLLEAFRLKWLLQFANFGMPVTMMLLSYDSVPLCILYDTANAVGPRMSWSEASRAVHEIASDFI